MPATFRQRFLSGERLLGTLLSIPSGAVAEILADTGFDWLFLDAEHGPLEVTELQTILQTVSRRIACLVRVPSQNEIPIKRALDLGAAGIIVPQVNTASEAEQVVQFSRYAPLGSRGVGISRAGGYGLNFQPYVASANDLTTVVVQAEHIRAVENIEEIVQTPGVDGVLVGPYDLSASMGLMGQIDHPDVVEAIDRVTRVCQAADMKLGIFSVTSDAILPYRDRGFTLLVAGVDTIMLGLGAAQLLHQMKT